VAVLALTSAALGSVALAGCGSASGEPGALAVPTFPATAGAPPSGAAGPGDEGRLPDDCTRVLTGNDLGALFGLPLDSVAVHTTLGVPAPSVGRTERLACEYTRSTGAHDNLLALNVGAYTDADSAVKQWRTNADAEDGTHRDVALGGARGVLVDRPQEVTLMVANGAETLTFVMPASIRIRDLSAGDTLVDLALRVLPAVSGAVAAEPPTTAPATPAAATSTRRPSSRTVAAG
jgi:hypothetical protein